MDFNTIQNVFMTYGWNSIRYALYFMAAILNCEKGSEMWSFHDHRSTHTKLKFETLQWLKIDIVKYI